MYAFKFRFSQRNSTTAANLLSMTAQGR
jgi:hypothetical protein